MWGAAHCHDHGVLWVNMDPFLAKNKKAIDIEKLHLQKAYENLMKDIIPSAEEELAVVQYVDQFTYERATTALTSITAFWHLSEPRALCNIQI